MDSEKRIVEFIKHERIEVLIEARGIFYFSIFFQENMEYINCSSIYVYYILNDGIDGGLRF